MPGSVAPTGFSPTPENYAQIAKARTTSTKLRRARIVALSGGWLTGVFAALTLLSSLGFSDPIGFGLGIGMGVVSFFEFRGAGELQRLMPGSPKRLAMNQIAFGILLFLYSAISLWNNLRTPNAMLAEVGNDPEMQKMLAPFADLGRTITIAVYTGMMAFAIIGPGCTAWYYASRAKHLTAYLRDTPQWLLDLQRAGMSV